MCDKPRWAAKPLCCISSKHSWYEWNISWFVTCHFTCMAEITCPCPYLSESDGVISWFVMTYHDNMYTCIMINDMFCHEMSPNIIICHEMSPNIIIMSWIATMLNWKIFHEHDMMTWTWWEFLWHLMIFDDFSWHFLSFFFFFFWQSLPCYSNQKWWQINCHDMSFNLTWWHLMSCYDVVNLIQRGMVRCLLNIVVSLLWLRLYSKVILV